MQNEETNSSIGSSNSSSVRYMSTLPNFVNDTIGKLLKIDNFKPQCMIEILGNFLGIVDYETNLATFWFLDILALQILRNNDTFDDYSRCIFISWLVGEMQLIRDAKCSREKFFNKMEVIFTETAKKIVQGEKIPHWNLIRFGDAEMKSEMEEEERKLSQEHDSSSLRDLKSRTQTLTEKNWNEEEILLDVIIRSTYDMYAGEVRYALVYAVFVEPIEIQVDNLPFSFRKPRPVRLADSNVEHFYIRLRNSLRKVEEQDSKKIRKVTSKKSTKGTKKLQRLKEESEKEYPPQPPNSLPDEDIISNERNFILPLIESNEAVAVFELHRGTI
ncbi:PREDICTED: uncharacterized protein LOC106787760 isoform X1 [Polistes canadensis]|uniref:uncharacterized protein LOC106787760 isoform X1 n=1 Tax=Polistes canadensis TaxID=91411 RepID=UPI00071905DA|nr:PREDICTED: uncharacterized protein LOC106787760 isoform X1 [Polistes canadensis]